MRTGPSFEILSPMVSFVIVGNCQAEAIQFLIERMVPRAKTRIVDISHRHMRSHDAIRSVLPSLCTADFVLHQSAVLSSDALAVLKTEMAGKLVGIANLYFRGLHPDLCFLGKEENREMTPALFHSLPVLDAFLRGHTERQALRSLSFESFERFGLFHAWETSLDQLRLRDTMLDVPAADFVDSYCREFSGFLNVHHPSLGLLHDYMMRVFNFLDISFAPFNAASCRDPLEQHGVAPVLDFVAQSFNLPYRTPQQWLLGYPSRRFVPLKDYVSACFHFYRTKKPEELIVHSPYDLRQEIENNEALRHLIDAKTSIKTRLKSFYGKFFGAG